MGKRRASYWLVPLGLYVLVLGTVFGSALLPGEGKILFGNDTLRTYYFFKEFFRSFLSQGVTPWWNPYLFAGQPIIAHPQAILMFHPLNWLFYLVSLNVAFSWYFAIHLLIAMAGMYWLGRRLSMPPTGAWAGGVVFGLGGFFMARIWEGHLDLVAAASYIPWVFGWFWEATGTGSRRATVYAALALSLQLLVGYQTMAIFTMEAVGIAVLIRCIVAKDVKPLMRVLLATFLGVGIAAVQLVPEFEFIRHSIRTFDLPYSWVANASLSASMLGSLVSPFLFGDVGTYIGPWPNYAEYALYVGRIGLGLAVVALVGTLGLILAKRRISSTQMVVVCFGAISLFALWVSLGSNAPVDLLYALWRINPLYHTIRIPPRHLVLFVFGMSMLAGWGIGLLRKKFVQVLVAVAILVELVPFAQSFIEVTDVPVKRHDPVLLTMLTSDTQLFRFLPNFGVWVSPRDALDFDAAASYRIFSTTGYDPSILGNYYEFTDAVNAATETSILQHDVQVPYLSVASAFTDFLNIKYIMVPLGFDPMAGDPSGRFRRVREDIGQNYRLYENTTVMPRFFLVPHATVVGSRTEAYQAIAKGAIDPKTTVVLSEDASNVAPTTACGQGKETAGDVEVRSYSPNEIRLEVVAPCAMYLVSSEVFYPGWDAFVDGKKTVIMEGNLAFRTLYVPGGNHSVVLRYVPRVFVLGGLVTLISLGVSLAIVRRENRSSGS